VPCMTASDKTATGTSSTDTPAPKRRLWQIHLRTALMISLLMGLLLFANIRATVIQDEEVNTEMHWLYGWPFIAVTVTARTWPSDDLARKIRNDPEILTIERFEAKSHGITSESEDGKETTLHFAPFLR
jgi:hypothetical protein